MRPDRRVRTVADVHEDYRLLLRDRAWARGPRRWAGEAFARAGVAAARRADLTVVADVGLLPDAFLARGADILGGVQISQPDEFLDLLAEGGSGYHFFGRVCEKVVLQRRQATARAA